jgi:hypothetical protein
VLKDHHIVGHVGHGLLTQPGDTEQVRRLEQEHDTDAGASQPLDQGVDELPEARLVGRRGHQIVQGVEDDAASSGFVDAVERLVDKLVDVKVDGGAVHHRDRGLGHAPAETADDAGEMGA